MNVNPRTVPNSYYQYTDQNGTVITVPGTIAVDGMIHPSLPYQYRSQADLLGGGKNNELSTPQQQRHYQGYNMMARPTHNQMTPDIWTSGCLNCPVHAPAQYATGTWTTGRRRAAHHIYDMPYGVQFDEQDVPCYGTGGIAIRPDGRIAWQNGPAVHGAAHPGGEVPPWHNGAGGSVSNEIDVGDQLQSQSPFYNELEPFGNIGSSTCIMPSNDGNQQTLGRGAGGGRAGRANDVAGQSNNSQQQKPPPIPLTRL